ncbi:MAG: repeat containing protein, partial [Chthoniobacter sp.]|nr:repeat containing protein [Chthoniobacter sp.]
MRIALWLTVAFLAASSGGLSAGNVTTFAGTGVKGFSGDGGPATAAQLNNPFAVGRGPDGALYICDVDNQRIRRVAPDGTISTFAGNGARGFSGDGGPATAAALNEPYELAWDAEGNLFFVERMNHAVRRIDRKTGVISTVAGSGRAGLAGDGGPASAAEFNQPHSLAFDAAGHLYVCDVLNHRIRRIDSKTGIISTWCGTGEKKTAADGSAIAGAALHGPRALAFDPDGRCWLALREGNAVLLLDPGAGVLKRVAGTGKSGFTGNGGPARDAMLAGPKGVSLDAGGPYLADTESHSIRRINRVSGALELIVGTGAKADGPDGDPLACRLARPHGVFVDPKDRALYIGD